MVIYVFIYYRIILSITTFSNLQIRRMFEKVNFPIIFFQLKPVFLSLLFFLSKEFQLLFSCLRMPSTSISHEMLLETTLLS